MHRIVFHYFYLSEESGACFPVWMEVVKCVTHPCLLAAVYGRNFVFCTLISYKSLSATTSK